MFGPMIKLLESKGFRVISVRRGKEPGPDIEAEREGRRLIMEMKEDSAVLGVDFGTGIFQLMCSMRDGQAEDYAFGISEVYVKHARRAEYALKELGIRIFVVDGKSYELW
jgi:hypothetical protein